ncbi:MAG: hypothetical protein ABSC51_01295 [Gaiellaceae bacterium]|jgi:phage FluMu protein Com
MGKSAKQPRPIRRLRWSGELPKPRSGAVPWAKKRPELADLSEADQALLVRDTDAWREVMVPVCKEIDAERSSRGVKFAYASEELELVLLFGRACGHTTYKKTRATLAGDDSRPRQILGFDKPRLAKTQPPKAHKTLCHLDGVPSGATMSRHKKRFSDEKRAEIWMEIERRLRIEHLKTPELQEEALLLNLDGSDVLTHYRAERTSKERGEEFEPAEEIDGARFQRVSGHRRKVTCLDGGFRGVKPGSTHPSGDGWNLLMISSSSGVPIAWRLVPIQSSEKDTALDLVKKEFASEAAPYLRGKLRVLSADGAFHKPELRGWLRKYGILENIHLASHATKSEKRAETLRESWHPIEGYPNWQANNHREIRCRCGKSVAKRVYLDGSGYAIARSEGKCPKCGSISVRSGDWRLTDHFVRCSPDELLGKRDWAFGNPLTFFDRNSKAYGNARFGHNEGLHGTLSNRFALIRNKRWFRKLAQAQIETAMTFALIQALALEQRRRAKEPVALAAAA